MDLRREPSVVPHKMSRALIAAEPSYDPLPMRDQSRSAHPNHRSQSRKTAAKRHVSWSLHTEHIESSLKLNTGQRS